MLYMLIKLSISAFLILIISEIAKRNSLMGSIFASIPLISVLAMIWLYIDTKNIQAVSMLSRDIFWLVLPSLILFLTLPILLKNKITFYNALGISVALTVVGYFFTILILKKFNVRM